MIQHSEEPQRTEGQQQTAQPGSYNIDQDVDMVDVAVSLPGFEALSMRQRQFLIALSSQFTMKDACRMIGTQPIEVRRWQETEPAFAEAYESINCLVFEEFLDEAKRRAKGFEERVVKIDPDGGTTVTTRGKHSDYCLKLVLQGLRPDLYGPSNVNVQQVNANQASISDEEDRKLNGIIELELARLAETRAEAARLEAEGGAETSSDGVDS